jgi:hypothetical protein
VSAALSPAPSLTICTVTWLRILGRLARLVRFAQMFGKGNAHGRLNVSRKRIPLDRTASHVAVPHQMRLRLILAMGGEPRFPDFAGVINGVLSFFMWIVQLIRGLLGFHATILRHSRSC